MLCCTRYFIVTERLTLLRICPVQKIPWRKKFIVLHVCLLNFILFCVCSIYVFREQSKFKLWKQVGIFHGKVVRLQGTEGQSNYGLYSPLDGGWILKAPLKDRAFYPVLLLLLFVTELLSCYLGEKDDQKGQQRPCKHSARIWNPNWGVANAYFIFEAWKRRLRLKGYGGRGGVALIFVSFSFSELECSECSEHWWREYMKFSALL